MVKQDSLLTKIAFLGISFVLTSAYAINGALPQMTEALHISSTEAQALATTPSITVTVFVLLSSFIAAKLGDKNTIILGVTLVGLAGIVPMFTDSYAIILVSRTVLGAGLGIFNSLAVSMIAVMYNGKTRAAMLGYRAAAEQVGQAVLTLLAGLLLAFGWRATFLVYLIAFPILFLFIKRVPDTSEMTPLQSSKSEKTTVEKITRISPLVLVFTLFAAFLVIDYMAIQLSFPFMATELKGEGYNTSPILSAMLIAATVGGVTYGWFVATFGRFTLQIGLVLMAISNFLVAFSHGNFIMLMAGVLLIGFPLQLISPFIFNQLPKLGPLARQSLITSIILIGFNVGVFIEPMFVATFASMIGHGGGSAAASAYATIPYLGMVLLIIAIVTVITSRKQEK